MSVYPATHGITSGKESIVIMEEKSKLLTIGQFAALHGINKKTLMWYDEIGLFKPAAVNPSWKLSCCCGSWTYP